MEAGHVSPVPRFGDVEPRFQVPRRRTFAPEVITERDSNLGSRREHEPPTLRLAKPEPWTLRAACVGQMELFDNEQLPARAIKVCEGCPVRDLCLSAAMEEEAGLGASARHLVRGGQTAAQRAMGGVRFEQPTDSAVG